MIYNLNGIWSFKQGDDPQVFQGTVPGCNFLDLLDNNLIADPFVGTNEKDCKWVGEKDWEYFRTFQLDEDAIQSHELWLKCNTLDTICDIYLNGVLIAKGNNAHRNYSFDIKDYAQVGTNHIRIYFYSPVQYVRKKQAEIRCPRNNNGQNGIPHIRKPQYHFGWDWGPVLPQSGICGDIYVESKNIAYLQDLEIIQTHSHNQDKVTLDINAQIRNIQGKSFRVMIGVLCPDGKIITEELQSKSTINATIVVDNPELWWTKELSGKEEQPLYQVKVAIFYEGKQLDKIEKNIGLRTIKLSRVKDTYGQDFCFIINGVRIFAKGANWIPSDSFPVRTTKEKLHRSLQSCLDSNFNMIRVWGGGYYETDEFYDFCDKKGLLVWQDFTFACQPYPFFVDEFLENVLLEVKDNVKRLRHHASLALWNGNNEIELMSIAWIAMKRFTKWTEKFFYDILPKYLAKYDKVTDYLQGSPSGVGYYDGFDKDNVGNTHLWAVWLGLHNMKYYRTRMTRFCSEFGFESLPHMDTIRTFAQEKDLSIGSKVMLSHQKCASGNNRMIYYIADRFRLPKYFQDFVYLSQVCQMECIEDAVWHWRRNKGRCNGALYWQLNDCWPVSSWSSMDYYGNYKALQYGTKKFLAPLAVCMYDQKNSIEVWGLNDLLADEQIQVVTRILDFNGQEIVKVNKHETFKAQESRQLFSIDISQYNKKMLKNCVIVTQAIKQGEVIQQITKLFAKEKNINFPKANIKVDCSVSNGIAKVNIIADKYVRLANIDCGLAKGQLSDNFFDLIPNENKTLQFEIDSNVSSEQVVEQLAITSPTDIVPRLTRISDFFTRIKIFLIPINFFSWIMYNNKPRDKKLKKIKDNTDNKK